MQALRRIILYVCAVALVGLAVFQSTDPPHPQALALGAGTKVVTALIAVIVARMAQPPPEA